MKTYTIRVYDESYNVIGRLDTYPDVDVTIDIALSDIREPEKRKTSFTYDFTLPGSKNNRKLFQPFFENDYSVTGFDPRFQLKAQLLVDGNPIFSGYLQMVSFDDTDDKIEYNVTFYETTYSFFDDLGEYSLYEGCDLSEFDHEFNYDNMIASWGLSNGPRKNYFNGQLIDAAPGFGYVYPFEDRGHVNVDKDVISNIDYWRPAIFLKTVIDKVFNKYGWKYESDFFNSDYFKKLILPFANDQFKVSNAALTSTGAQANLFTNVIAKHTNNTATLLTTKPINSGSGNYWYGQYAINQWDDDTTSPATDINDVWTSGNKFTAPLGGTYEISARQRFLCMFIQPNYTYGVFNGKTSNKFKITPGSDGMPYIRFEMILNGSVYKTTDFRFVQPSNTTTFNGQANLYIMASFTEAMNLNAGDTIQFRYRPVITPGNKWKNSFGGNTRYDIFEQASGSSGTNTPFSGAKQVRIYRTPDVLDSVSTINTGAAKDQLVSIKLKSSQAVTGDYISVGSGLPNIKTKDLFTSLNKMFNLYWKPVPGKDRVLEIEPYDQFFGISNSIEPFKDLTPQLMEEEIVNVQPLYELTAKEYLFTYNEDTDWANDDYLKSWGRVYGDRLIDTSYGLYTDFITDKTEIKPIFSATPITTIGPGKNASNTNFIYAPSYTTKDGNGNNKGIVPKPRILFWNGLQYRNDYKIVKYKATTSGQVIDKTWTWTYVPEALHLNDPINPTEDLDFGICKEYYWDTWNHVSNSNLFNRFWRNWINGVIHKDGHLLTAKFRMKPLDMANFDIRNIYQVRGVNYRVNNLKYSVTKEIADIELIRAITFPEFKASVGFVAPNPGNPWTPGTGTGWTSNPNSPGWIRQQWLEEFVPYTVHTSYAGLYPDPWQENLGPIVPPTTFEPAPITNPITTPYSINAQFVSYWSTGWNTSIPTIGNKPWVDDNKIYPALTESSQEVIPAKPYTEALAGNNTYLPSQLVAVRGSGNNISKRISGPVSIVGSNNRIEDNAANVFINGNRNIIRGGIENVVVIGDDQIVDESNIAYINGTRFTPEGVQIAKIDLYRGGIDEVQNKYSIEPTTNLKGGKDTVRDYASEKVIQVISPLGNNFNIIEQ